MKEILMIFSCIALASCAVGPQPIAYGTDGCHFCKMTIVDVKFGAELVTSKGKVFKFDAVECLINYTRQNPSDEGDTYYVTNYLNGEWIAGDDAYFLRSRQLPSPMGQFITSLATREAAEELQNEYKGIIQSWNELKENLEIANIENF